MKQSAKVFLIGLVVIGLSVPLVDGPNLRPMFGIML